MESSAVSAVGVWFYSDQTQRLLYLMRNDPKHPHSWGLPGGKAQSGETLLSVITRECQEELGFMPDYQRLFPLEQFTSNDGKFTYHTFFCQIAEEFCPLLNDEHVGYAWVDIMRWPKPMHPGLWNTVNFEEVLTKISTIRDQIHTSQ